METYQPQDVLMHLIRSDIPPCPECASSDVWMIEDGDNPILDRARTFSIYCRNCGAGSGPWTSKDIAIGQWKANQ